MPRFVWWIAAAVVAGLGGWGLFVQSPDAAVIVFASMTTVVLVVGVMALAIFAAILVHELGHVVAGRWAGFDFRTLSVGPLEVRREGGRLSLGRAPRMRGIGGMVRMLPQGRHDLDRRLSLFIAGGPIASLVWLLVTYGFYRYSLGLHLPKSIGSAVFEVLVVLLVTVAAILILGSILPFDVRSGNPTDMKLLLALRGKTEERSRVVAWFLLAKELLDGVRARDWSRDLLEQARLPEDGGDGQVRAEYLLYLHHLDQGDLVQARQWLERTLPNAERLNKGHLMRECIFLEAAFVAAWLDRDLPSALRNREYAGKENELLKGTRARVDAAIAVREGQGAKALTLADEAETRLREHSRRYGGDLQAEMELIEAIRHDARA